MNPLWKYASIGLAVTLVCTWIVLGIMRAELAVERKAREVAEQNLAAYEAASTAVIKDRLAAQEQTRLANERKTKETVSAYEKRIGDIRAAYDERLRIAAGGAGSTPAVPGTPAAPSGTDGAPVPEFVARFLGDLRACEEDRERLIALQNWIRETR